jgi:hypothetical protein
MREKNDKLLLGDQNIHGWIESVNLDVRGVERV